MKKILPMILVFITVFSCVFAFTACDKEETLGKWDIRQFYGTYENVDRGVFFSIGGSCYHAGDHWYTTRLEAGKIITNLSTFEYDFITQEIADWANIYLNNFATKIVIDKKKIYIGDLEYAYEKTFSYDIDENGELYDEHYLLLAIKDKDELSFAVGYGPNGEPAINFKFETEINIDGSDYRILIYHFLYKTN